MYSHLGTKETLVLHRHNKIVKTYISKLTNHIWEVAKETTDHTINVLISDFHLGTNASTLDPT